MEALRKYLLKNNYDAEKLMKEGQREEEATEGEGERDFEAEIDHPSDRFEDNKDKRGKRSIAREFC